MISRFVLLAGLLVSLIQSAGASGWHRGIYKTTIDLSEMQFCKQYTCSKREYRDEQIRQTSYTFKELPEMRVFFGKDVWGRAKDMSISAKSGDLSKYKYRIAATELVYLFSASSIIEEFSENCITSMDSSYTSRREIVIEGDILHLFCVPSSDKTVDSTDDGYDSINISIPY